jgi:hypothetical protein
MRLDEIEQRLGNIIHEFRRGGARAGSPRVMREPLSRHKGRIFCETI